jgi:hypothetical protein
MGCRLHGVRIQEGSAAKASSTHGSRNGVPGADRDLDRLLGLVSAASQHTYLAGLPFGTRDIPPGNGLSEGPSLVDTLPIAPEAGEFERPALPHGQFLVGDHPDTHPTDNSGHLPRWSAPGRARALRLPARPRPNNRSLSLDPVAEPGGSFALPFAPRSSTRRRKPRKCWAAPSTDVANQALTYDVTDRAVRAARRRARVDRYAPVAAVAAIALLVAGVWIPARFSGEAPSLAAGPVSWLPRVVTPPAKAPPVLGPDRRVGSGSLLYRVRVSRARSCSPRTGGSTPSRDGDDGIALSLSPDGALAPARHRRPAVGPGPARRRPPADERDRRGAPFRTMAGGSRSRPPPAEWRPRYVNPGGAGLGRDPDPTGRLVEPGAPLRCHPQLNPPT